MPAVHGERAECQECLAAAGIDSRAGPFFWIASLTSQPKNSFSPFVGAVSPSELKWHNGPSMFFSSGLSSSCLRMRTTNGIATANVRAVDRYTGPAGRFSHPISADQKLSARSGPRIYPGVQTRRAHPILLAAPVCSRGFDFSHAPLHHPKLNEVLANQGDSAGFALDANSRRSPGRRASLDKKCLHWK